MPSTDNKTEAEQIHMQIVLHAGAHCTDDDRILKCLLKNRAEFAEIGSIVPPPGRYRRLLRQTVQALKRPTRLRMRANF